MGAAPKLEMFGTDGFRGQYDPSDELDAINAPTFANLSYAYTQVLRSEQPDTIPVVLVGGDTRKSSRELRKAVAEGAAEAGAEVWHVGIAPTPVIAWLAQYHNVGAVAVTASHNPDTDNGFKPFAIGGSKMSEERLAATEETYRQLGTRRVGDNAPGFRIRHRFELRNEYLQIVRNHLDRFGGLGTLEGQTVALDCANGAAYEMAPRLFRSLGAEVIAVACDADEDINAKCGATYLGNLKTFWAESRELTRRHNVVGGLAFDGDADRVMGVSTSGQELNGNHFMNELADSQRGIVGTVYTNTALRRAVESRGVEFHECANGDSYVTSRLRELTYDLGPGYTRGGEPTGHMIDTDHLPSGDGLFMGAWLLMQLARKGATMDDLADNLKLWPERIHNVRFEGANAKAQRSVATQRAQELKDELEAKYPDLHIVVRPSGTEPLLRLWAEGEQQDLVDEAMRVLNDSVQVAA